MAASLATPDVLFVGGVNAYRSTDGGRTLAAINPWAEHCGNPDGKLHADLPGIECLLLGGREPCFFATGEYPVLRHLVLGATRAGSTPEHRTRPFRCRRRATES